jgi:hypothetical protein
MSDTKYIRKYKKADNIESDFERDDEICDYIEFQNDTIVAYAHSDKYKAEKNIVKPSLKINNVDTKIIHTKLSQSLFSQSLDANESESNKTAHNRTVNRNSGMHKPKSILKKCKP